LVATACVRVGPRSVNQRRPSMRHPSRGPSHRAMRARRRRPRHCQRRPAACACPRHCGQPRAPRVHYADLYTRPLTLTPSTLASSTVSESSAPGNTVPVAQSACGRIHDPWRAPVVIRQSVVHVVHSEDSTYSVDERTHSQRIAPHRDPLGGSLARESLNRRSPSPNSPR